MELDAPVLLQMDALGRIGREQVEGLVLAEGQYWVKYKFDIWDAYKSIGMARKG